MGYLGAKSNSGLFQAIVALMPPHDTYAEIFAGSAVILARKQLAARSIVLDLDPRQVAQLQAGPLAQLAGVEIRQANALAWLAALDPAGLGRLLIYADPPYLHALRSRGHRYRCEMTDADHEALAAALQRLAALGVAVIVSGYPSPLYDRLFAGWRTIELQVMTRGGVRTEKLWFNFEPGAAHWATFAGRDFTDRQRIKRKAARWARMFGDLPPAERQAVLAAILGAASSPSAQPPASMVESAIDAGDYAAGGLPAGRP